MLKTKSKFKLLLALGIILLSMLLLGTTNVNANVVSEMSQQEIAVFNAQFKPYAGENISGTNVKTLINTVKASNASNENQVKVNKEISEIDNAERYEVMLKYDNDGKVNEVIIGQTIILSAIPNSINVTQKSTEYEEILSNPIIENTIKSYIKTDLTDYTISWDIVTTSNGKLRDISKAKIDLLKNNTIVETKTINIVYSDNSKRNENDKNYVESTMSNINLSTSFEYEFTTNASNIIDTQLKKCFNNTGLEYIETDYGSGGLEIGEISQSALILIVRNGVAYFGTNYEMTGKNVITVPASVEDTDKAIIDYSLPKIKEFVIKCYGEDEEYASKLTLTKGTNKDEYIVTDENGGTETIIIRKLKQENTNVNVTDKTTNIKLETNTGVVPADIILNSNKITTEKTLNTIKTALKDISTKYISYDITLTSNGVKIQPNGKVTISIPIPTDYDKTKLAVYRIADDGTKTKYDVKVIDNLATFETDHFSTYVLVENNVVNNTNSKEKDDTPKTGNLDIINYVLVITALAGIGIIAFKKYSK